MEDKYIQRETKPKLELLLIMLLFALPYTLLLVGVLPDYSRIDTDGLTSEEQTTLIFDSLHQKIYINSYLLVVYLLVSITGFILARKTHISRQFPPPGVSMPFKTKIIKNKKALHNSYAMYFASAMLFLNGVVQFGVSVHMLHFIKGTLNAI